MHNGQKDVYLSLRGLDWLPEYRGDDNKDHPLFISAGRGERRTRPAGSWLASTTEPFLTHVPFHSLRHKAERGSFLLGDVDRSPFVLEKWTPFSEQPCIEQRTPNSHVALRWVLVRDPALSIPYIIWVLLYSKQPVPRGATNRGNEPMPGRQNKR